MLAVSVVGLTLLPGTSAVVQTRGLSGTDTLVVTNVDDDEQQ